MSQVTWNSINQIAWWAAKLWTVPRACMGQIFTLGWLTSPDPVLAGDGISASPGLWQKSALSCSYVWVKVKQLSQGNTRVKNSSTKPVLLFNSQQCWHIKVAKVIREALSNNRALNQLFFHITVRFLKHCGRKAVGEGRGERNWILYFLLAEQGGRHKICVTL